MKVIFLDFDGVLNSDRYVRNCGHFGVVIDPSRLELIKRLIDRTDAEIVLSTSWRMHWSAMREECDATGELINSIFLAQGLRIYDKIPILSSGRESEIKKWLDDNPNVDRFVVFDDLYLDISGFLDGHFVKTSNLRNGVEAEDVETAVKILNG